MKVRGNNTNTEKEAAHVKAWAALCWKEANFMKNEMWRIRISILWIADVVALAATFALAMFEPEYLEGILSGNLEGIQITVAVTLLASFFWLVPILMMYFSLVLSKSVLRWFNIIFGLLLGILNLVDFFGQITSFEASGVARTMMIALMVIIPLLIAWHGWKWPSDTV
jgi:hypothetical protein